MLFYFSSFGYIHVSWEEAFGKLAFVALAATIVECIPVTDVVDDNISVPLATMLVAFLLFGSNTQWLIHIAKHITWFSFSAITFSAFSLHSLSAIKPYVRTHAPWSLSSDKLFLCLLFPIWSITCGNWAPFVLRIQWFVAEGPRSCTASDGLSSAEKVIISWFILIQKMWSISSLEASHLSVTGHKLPKITYRCRVSVSWDFDGTYTLCSSSIFDVMNPKHL